MVLVKIIYSNYKEEPWEELIKLQVIPRVGEQIEIKSGICRISDIIHSKSVVEIYCKNFKKLD